MSIHNLSDILSMAISHKISTVDRSTFYRLALLGWPSSMHSDELVSKDFSVEELPIQIYGKTLTLTLII